MPPHSQYSHPLQTTTTKRPLPSNHQSTSSLPPLKTPKLTTIISTIHFTTFDTPLTSRSTRSPIDSIRLHPQTRYTLGRDPRLCDFVLDHPQVSKQHFQIYFDPSDYKLYVVDGTVKESLNGVFVDGVRVGINEVKELSVGSEVLVVCGNVCCSVSGRIGFIVEKISFDEAIVGGNRVAGLGGGGGFGGGGSGVVVKAGLLSSVCRRIVSSDDPVLCIRECINNRGMLRVRFTSRNRFKVNSRYTAGKFLSGASVEVRSCEGLSVNEDKNTCTDLESNGERLYCGVNDGHLQELVNERVPTGSFVYKDRVSVARFSSACPSVEFGSCEGLTVIEDKNNSTDLELNGEQQVVKDRGSTGTCVSKDKPRGDAYTCEDELVEYDEFLKSKNRGVCISPPGNKFSSRPVVEVRSCEGLTVIEDKSNCAALDSNGERIYCSVNDGQLQELVNESVPVGNFVYKAKDNDIYTCEEKFVESDESLKPKNRGVCVPPPGNKFYLNRLHFMGDEQSQEVSVTLPELLYPVETLKQVFIATFTSDLSWFLSYCEIPDHLPITVACHNTERCWSSSPEKRTSRPYSDFPNLVVIYPQFPEVISFGKEKKKFGIACHHPKLFVLQRDDSIRVIITSANLVSKQWLRVTNTVWWQDFPRAKVPDYMSLFAKSSTEEVNKDSKSDFAAQLAGFMATLLVGVPDQAHWILELTKFDFSNAAGHLVASVPGIYSSKHPYISKSLHYLTGASCTLRPLKFVLLGSVEASVVGISHLFRTSADSNGALLKRLARAIGTCHVGPYGLIEVILSRSLNIAADANAISVAIPHSGTLADGGIRVGFLPRDVAKWVAPLSDSGLFAFSAYIYPKEVLACALEGSNNKAHLVLYVYQGPNFHNISKVVSPALASAMCSLVASNQRCSGLWRLQEILGHYKWPEQWETDFTFGSSSVGAVNAPFLAAFSAATGKRSLQLSESEESDPDWGCWSASQELRNPSIRIIFPTIERVKTATCGIWASKYILCFSQKTWLRLKHLRILHDAIPHPIDRVGHPMHVKVARRRFQSRTNTPSFGWVYCGSHNFSAAAWGRPIHSQSGLKSNEDSRIKSVLGSRLHICNYEFGIVFIVPPLDNESYTYTNKKHSNLDDITLPFVVPAPRYRPMDTPATKFAMSKLAAQRREKIVEPTDVEEETPNEDEEEVLELPDVIVQEKEDDKVYAEKLWGLS